MMQSGSTFVSTVTLLLTATISCAAEATTDFGRRNEAFAPSATISPAKRQPGDSAMQEKRANLPALVPPSPAAIGDRRASIAIAETRAKNFLAPDVNRPVSRALPLNAFDHRLAGISPSAGTRQPAFVSKYQGQLASANAVTIGRTPVLKNHGTAQFNRFVFRRDESSPLPASASATPAGGNSR